MSNDQQAPLRDMTGEVSPDASFDGRGTDDEDVVVPSFNLDDGDTKDIDLDLQGTTQSTIPKDNLLTDAAQMASYKRQRRAFKEHTSSKPTSCYSCKDDQPPHHVY